MATWIISAVLLAAIVIAARYCWKKFRRGECIGCPGGGCSGCESVCPAGLVPYKIEFALLDEDYDLCEKLYASECIACGCCSYICPARRELSVRTRTARDIVKQRIRERAVKKS